MSERLLTVVGTLDAINVKYAWLIENDNIWIQKILDQYHMLFQLNRKFMDNILKQLGTTDYKFASPQFSELTPHIQTPESEESEQSEQSEKDELGTMMKVEVALHEVCDGYEKLLDNNPYATEEIKNFYKPYIQCHISCIKRCKRIVYSYM